MKVLPAELEQRKKIDIRPGDTIRIWQRVQEGGKTRRQMFEGLIIARKHGAETGASFTVRKIAAGIGVELTFPLYSPKIEKIERVSRPRRVRRAKLYYVREKAAKAIRKKMKQARQVKEVVMEKTPAENKPSETEAEKE